MQAKIRARHGIIIDYHGRLAQVSTIGFETIFQSFDNAVPGETVRGRALLVTATQASHQPLGFLCVAWFVVASSLNPDVLQGTACYNYLGLGVAISPPFITKRLQ